MKKLLTFDIIEISDRRETLMIAKDSERLQITLTKEEAEKVERASVLLKISKTKVIKMLINGSLDALIERRRLQEEARKEWDSLDEEQRRLEIQSQDIQRKIEQSGSIKERSELLLKKIEIDLKISEITAKMMKLAGKM